jgi:predicted ester cyclase
MLRCDEETMSPPFTLPARPEVTRIRKRDAAGLAAPAGERRQAMAGFEPQYVDIVDYIIRITDEIWMDRAVGRIYDTYDSSCTIYSSYGVVRSVEEVIAGTIATLNAFPDGEIHHLNVAWSGDEDAGFYTSHLGHSRSTNLGRTQFGPATGKRASIRFAADCISQGNRIHTEWLVRDNGALIRQLGFDLHETARTIAQAPAPERYVVAPETRLEGQAPRRALDLPSDTAEGWARHMFHNLWNLKRFDRLGDYYAEDAVVHAGGGRVATGIRSIGSLLIHVQAAIPDGVMRVDHVCWSEESDGIILAIRWSYEGTTAPGGALGECPTGKPVFMMGVTHARLAGDRIAEEWTIFDELGVLAQAYRP